jgi:hypothetical protein
MRREYWYLKLTQALMRSHRLSQVSCNAIEVSRSRKAFSASNENFCLGSSVEARTCHGVPHCPQELSPLPKFGAGRRTLLDYGGSRSAESRLRVKYYVWSRRGTNSTSRTFHQLSHQIDVTGSITNAGLGNQVPTSTNWVGLNPC